MDANETLGVLGETVDKSFSLPVGEPIFWELLLVLFLLSLKFWRIQRSAFFIVALCVLVLSIPLWAFPLSRYLFSHGFILDGEIMRIMAVFLIAAVFYVYIVRWK